MPATSLMERVVLAARFLSYRFRTSLRSRLGGYAALVVVLGLLGGTAMASVSAGRRTQSSFSAFLAATNASDLIVSTSDVNSDSGLPSHYSAAFNARVARLTGVSRAESAITLNAAPLRADGSPDSVATSQITALGSIDGLYFDADRPGLVTGRMPDPRRADEFVATVAAGRLLRVRVGQTAQIGFYSNTALESPAFGSPKIRPLLTVSVKLVGLIVFSNQIVQDDVDRLQPPLLFTPTLTRHVLSLSPDTEGPTQFGLDVAGGAGGVAAVKQRFTDELPSTSAAAFQQSSLVQQKVEASVRPESIALGVFGGIAGAAAVVIAALMISRQLRSDDDGLRVLRALGASPMLTSLDAALGVVGAVFAGAMVAAVVAVLVSPVTVLGPVRPVYPSSGLDADWLVLAGGFAVLFIVPSVAALVQGYRTAPHRLGRTSQATAMRTSTFARAAAYVGAPLPAVLGLRMGLERGRGSSSVPVRSTLAGAVVGIAVVTATLTFGSGLHTLVTHPRLYGWNWTYAISATNIVPPQATSRLDTDPAVAAWTGYHQATIRIDHEIVPVLMSAPGPAVGPPILVGNGLQADGQIVLGASTLADLHKRVGDTVVASYGRPKDAPFYIPPTTLTVVGMATLPALGKPGNGQDHLTIGRGAVVTSNLVPPAFQAVFDNPEPTLNGPN